MIARYKLRGEVTYMTKDMTQGNPMKLILGFAIPTLLGYLFQQFYNLIDTLIVGRYLGVGPLAAVGSTGSVNFLVIGFCMGICVGFSIPVAHKFGAGDYAGVRKYVANCVWLGVFFSVVMTLAMAFLCRDILRWMNTPTDIFEDAYAYIYVIFIGIPTVFLYNILSGIIRALGDGKTPVIFLVISSVMNVILDLVFIVNFKMGVAGAAWATVISQGFSGLLCLIFMIKKFDILRISKEEWKPNAHMMGSLCSMGLPMGLQYSITAIGSILLQTGINGLGSHAVAAVSTGNKVTQVICCPLDALGTTVATYGGQNIGAKKLDRISKGMVSCLLFGTLYSIVAYFIIRYLGPTLLSLFIGPEETSVIEQAQYFIVRWVTFCIPLMMVYVFRFMIQGLGFSKLAVFAGVFEMLARGLISLFWIPAAGFEAVCYASPVAWIAADVFLIPAYLGVMKKLRRDLSVTAG